MTSERIETATEPTQAATPIAARWGRVWLWSLVAWGALTVLFEIPIMLMLYERGAIRRWEHLLVAPTMHVVSALLTPLMLMVVWRCPLDRDRRVRHVVCVVAALLALSAVDDVFSYYAMGGLRWFFPEVHPLKVWPLSALTSLFAKNVMLYSEIAAVAYAFLYYRHYRERSLRAAQLETRLVQARLEVLRRQLHPHFLFNTLNTVTALMHRDAEAAERMIARLSELLRAALDEDADQEVALGRELELLSRYVEIEKVRFGDRLTVIENVDPQVLEARVPTFVLQVLVENALRHGLGRRSGPGTVEVAARREGATLVLRVSDDGPGLDRAASSSSSGIGLANTRSRLDQLYGAASSLDLAPRDGGGTVATVCVPYRASEPHTAADRGWAAREGQDRSFVAGKQGTLPEIPS